MRAFGDFGGPRLPLTDSRTQPRGGRLPTFFGRCLMKGRRGESAEGRGAIFHTRAVTRRHLRGVLWGALRRPSVPLCHLHSSTMSHFGDTLVAQSNAVEVRGLLRDHEIGRASKGLRRTRHQVRVLGLAQAVALMGTLGASHLQRPFLTSQRCPEGQGASKLHARVSSAAEPRTHGFP